ncbi:hypothetical protein NDU88_001024 [Pleurodeles waltl]|uniref:Uncharacterized protein n=1 Tax=Pleurodeles waltl TaxID=8319 RepID=A0AAV7VXY8_PLEWA|nr:hypothetical protein NDU88_001024 [Pleurodeles waltl]
MSLAAPSSPKQTRWILGPVVPREAAKQEEEAAGHRGTLKIARVMSLAAPSSPKQTRWILGPVVPREAAQQEEKAAGHRCVPKSAYVMSLAAPSSPKQMQWILGPVLPREAAQKEDLCTLFFYYITLEQGSSNYSLRAGSGPPVSWIRAARVLNPRGLVSATGPL